MAAISTVIAAASLAVAAGGAYMSYEQQRQASRNADRAEEEQNKIRAEQKAQNAAKAAQERRAQIREERVRRARLLQSAENTGTSESSGALGGLGALATNLSSNIGMNIGALAASNRISQFSQNAGGFQSAAGQNMANAGLFNQIGGFAGSIFNQAGGFSSLFGPSQTPNLSPLRTAGSMTNTTFSHRFS